MEKIVVGNCPTCDPVNNLIHSLQENNFVITEQRIEDYHFHQLYFKLKGPNDYSKKIAPEGFKKIENKFICNCHWSTVELCD